MYSYHPLIRKLIELTADGDWARCPTNSKGNCSLPYEEVIKTEKWTKVNGSSNEYAIFSRGSDGAVVEDRQRREETKEAPVRVQSNDLKSYQDCEM